MIAERTISRKEVVITEPDFDRLKRLVDSPRYRVTYAMLIAALCADGVTEVGHTHHIERGYPAFEADLCRLGAKVERVPAPVDPPTTASSGASRRLSRGSR